MINQKEIFSFSEISEGFDMAINNTIQRVVEKRRDDAMPSENVAHYVHGRKWLQVADFEAGEEGEFEEHSHEEIIDTKSIISHDLSCLYTFITNVCNAVHSEFMQYLFKKVHETTEKTGNVVKASDCGSQAEAFLEMLRSIEFGVDRQGNISRPEIHLAPQAFESFVASLERQDEEFHQLVEKLTEEKEHSALTRETKRKARFKTDAAK